MAQQQRLMTKIISDSSEINQKNLVLSEKIFKFSFLFILKSNELSKSSNLMNRLKKFMGRKIFKESLILQFDHKHLFGFIKGSCNTK